MKKLFAILMALSILLCATIMTAFASSFGVPDIKPFIPPIVPPYVPVHTPIPISTPVVPPSLFSQFGQNASSVDRDETTVPEELVGEWKGVGTPKNGGTPIDLTITVNADGSGEYTFDQGSYHESYPFTISNDDSTFSVDIPATSMLGNVGGAWALEDGKLKLDITSEFTNGGSYSYTVVCEKAESAQAAWEGRDWQLDTVHFKTLSDDSPFSIDAGMSLNGSATYGNRLRLERGGVATDIDMNGLIEAVPDLPFSVPELDLTQYEGYAADGDAICFAPGDFRMQLGYDDAADGLTLTCTTRVDIQSRDMGNGMRTQAGESDLEVILGFAPMDAASAAPTEAPTPEPTPTPTPTPSPTPTPEPAEEPEPTETPVPADIVALNKLHDRAVDLSGGDFNAAACAGDLIVAIYNSSSTDVMPAKVLTADSDDDYALPREYRAASFDEARWAAIIYPVYKNVGFYSGGGGPAEKTTTWLKLFDLETDEMYSLNVATENPPSTISVTIMNGIPIASGGRGKYCRDLAVEKLAERIRVERLKPTPTPASTPVIDDVIDAGSPGDSVPADRDKQDGHGGSGDKETPPSADGEIPAEAPMAEQAEGSDAAGETGEAPSYAAAAEDALNALADETYRATYNALLTGEAVQRGSKGDAARGVQQTLVAFGQKIAVDGNVGPKTIAALNAVQAAFGLEQTEALDAAGYAELLPRLLTVVNPDEADALLKGKMDGGEYDYMRACALVAQGKYYSARTIFKESGWGDWEARAEACVQPWPKTGVLYKNPAVKGSSTQLTVKVNTDSDTAMLVKVYTENGTLARTLFIGGTGKATTSLPAGTYTIKDGTGRNWYGEEEAFGQRPEGYYEVMTFDNGAREVRLKKNYSATITVNAQEGDPTGEGVGHDWEDWQNF